MKAISHAGKVLKLIDANKPMPKQNEVLIKIKATSLNRADIAQKNGQYPPPPGASEILGLECSGIIESLGKNVTSLSIGDEVCALLAGGGYAEFVTCPAGQVIRRPNKLSWEEAASLPEIYATCWLNLIIEANLKKKERVLVHAGASGIGTACIQLCNALGGEVLVSVGSKSKLEFCKKLGAKEGGIREEIFNHKEIKEKGVDIILDSVGANYLQNNLNILNQDGRLIIIGLLGGIKSELNLGKLMIKRHRIIGSTIRARSEKLKSMIMHDLEQKVWPFIEKGVIEPVIHEVFDISEAQKAHEVMEENLNIGKLVLRIT
tara:strand:+ start:81294 stop:82250 length:957 start_codon:yes stop_codon:yes gene_type:complete